MRSANLLAVAPGLFFLGACGLHLGRPPVGEGFHAGEVLAPVVEPGVGDAVREGLASSLRGLGGGGAVAINALVERAAFTPVAGMGGQVGAWRAELHLRFSLAGREGSVLMVRHKVVDAPPMGDLRFHGVRAAAFRDLAALMAQEAVVFYSVGSPGGSARPEGALE